MAQGEFTIEEAAATREAVEEMFKALPKRKMMEFVGHLNDILLFIGAAEQHLAAESKQQEEVPA